jgi:maltooligosyltrehalose trehalohydrolase
VALEDREPVELQPEAGGYFAGTVPGVAPGALYRLVLDGRDGPFPDPASRFQPTGPEGPSQVVDPSAYRWRDGGWRGPEPHRDVFYEMHVGTFTPEGTWAAAARELPALAALGITILEVMPVAEFAGEFGWGYDGVDLFAPTRLYGAPDDFRAFVDAAHGLGLAVILDVVYNHFGPRGCFLRELSPSYFTDRHANEWGESIDFDGPESGGVRELVLANVEHWIAEYHLDGLRLDATQAIHDSSEDHLLAAIGRRARQAAGGRRVVLVAENEPQDPRQVRPPDRGGHGLDGMWNDDFHHSAAVAATGRSEAYTSPYRGTAQELLSAIKHGFLYQGQLYPWQKQRRGASALDLRPDQLVCFLENHDQVANMGPGLRLHQRTSPGRWGALTAVLLLAPQTPLLFQGQEHASRSLWTYFADHPGELGRQVREGRAEFLRQFPSLARPESSDLVLDPCARATFEACKLDPAERRRDSPALRLHRDLLRLRREDPVFGAIPRGRLDGAVLSRDAFVVRFFGEDGDDRLLVVNLGRQLALPAAAEPLLGPPTDRRWQISWSSDHPDYGGLGTPPLDTDEEGWRIPGEAAVVLSPSEEPT